MQPLGVLLLNLNIELQKIVKNSDKEKLVKRYLLDCCEKLVPFRSSGCLSKNLLVARRYLNGQANRKLIHQAEWELEGEAFGVEYYSEKGVQIYFRTCKIISTDLLKVRILKGLTNNESRKYLEDMAYFIDRVFCHVEYTSNWLFTNDCEKFMCPRIYSKHFGVAA